jgi:hypothetical protein
MQDPELVELTRRLLAPYVVDDPEVPANFSLKFAEDEAEGRPRQFHLLYRAYSVFARARGATRLLNGLAAGLSVHDEQVWPGDHTGVTALAVTRGEDAVLIPAHFRHFTDQLEPRLTRGGLRLALTSNMILETGTGRLVIPEPGLRLDPDAIAAFEQRYPTPPSERPPAEPGPYVLRAWGTVRVAKGTPMTIADGVAKTVDQVNRPASLTTQDVVDTMLAAYATATPFAVAGKVPEVADQLIELLGA